MLSILSSLLAFARTSGSASGRNYCRFGPAHRSPPCGAVLVVRGRSNLCHRRLCRVFHGRQRQDRFAADLGTRILQFLDQRRHGVLGRGSNLAQHEARPVGRLLVAQGIDQPRHGLGTGSAIALRTRIRTPGSESSRSLTHSGTVTCGPG